MTRTRVSPIALALVLTSVSACMPKLSAAPSASGRMTFQAPAQAANDQVTAPFSDPSRPGLIHVSLVQGSITVRGPIAKMSS